VRKPRLPFVISYRLDLRICSSFLLHIHFIPQTWPFYRPKWRGEQQTSPSSAFDTAHRRSVPELGLGPLRWLNHYGHDHHQPPYWVPDFNSNDIDSRSPASDCQFACLAASYTYSCLARVQCRVLATCTDKCAAGAQRPPSATVQHYLWLHRR
jgi:hypothetical protein